MVKIDKNIEIVSIETHREPTEIPGENYNFTRIIIDVPTGYGAYGTLNEIKKLHLGKVSISQDEG